MHHLDDLSGCNGEIRVRDTSSEQEASCSIMFPSMAFQAVYTVWVMGNMCRQLHLRLAAARLSSVVQYSMSLLDLLPHPRQKTFHDLSQSGLLEVLKISRMKANYIAFYLFPIGQH